jgi:hypothetical protein
MGLNRFHFLLMLGIAAVMLAGCNSFLTNQAAAPQPAEEATTAGNKVEASPAESVEEESAIDTGAESAEEKAPITAEESEALLVDEDSSEVQEEAQVDSSDDETSHLTEEGLVATVPTGKSLQPQLEQANIDLNQVVTLLPPDAIRAVNPDEVSEIMVTAEEAQESGLDPSIRVMGVSINGESHAYPIPFLSRHEIINAEVGGKLIAATW